MRASNSVIAACLVALCTVSTSAYALDKAPGCFKRDKLEASIKDERTIPYDAQAPRLKYCHVTQPLVSMDLRREGKTRVAIFVFDVTGSGRVVEQQLIGQKTSWSEIAAKEVATWLFEPLVEGGIGITRVGVTVALIAEFQDEEHGCRGSQEKGVISGIDFEILVCAPRK
jgi:hypothetical protein